MNTLQTPMHTPGQHPIAAIVSLQLQRLVGVCIELGDQHGHLSGALRAQHVGLVCDGSQLAARGGADA